MLQPAWAATEEVGRIFVTFLTPMAVIAFVLAVWRLSRDLGWTEDFVISNGFFSHWQVWIVLAAGLEVSASWLAARFVRRPKISEENQEPF